MSQSNQPSRQLSQESVSSQESCEFDVHIDLAGTFQSMLSNAISNRYTGDDLRDIASDENSQKATISLPHHGDFVLPKEGFLFLVTFCRTAGHLYHFEVEELPCQ